MEGPRKISYTLDPIRLCAEIFYLDLKNWVAQIKWKKKSNRKGGPFKVRYERGIQTVDGPRDWINWIAFVRTIERDCLE